MRVVGVIPSRYDSTRLPGKPLADICGKPMIQYVYERATGSKLLGNVIVATDDERIVEAVQGFGGEAALTSPDHPNGTSRVAEVARNMDTDIVINIQGDEPLIDSRMIDEVVHRRALFQPFPDSVPQERSGGLRVLRTYRHLRVPKGISSAIRRASGNAALETGIAGTAPNPGKRLSHPGGRDEIPARGAEREHPRGS